MINEWETTEDSFCLGSLKFPFEWIKMSSYLLLLPTVSIILKVASYVTLYRHKLTLESEWLFMFLHKCTKMHNVLLQSSYEQRCFCNLWEPITWIINVDSFMVSWEQNDLWEVYNVWKTQCHKKLSVCFLTLNTKSCMRPAWYVPLAGQSNPLLRWLPQTSLLSEQCGHCMAAMWNTQMQPGDCTPGAVCSAFSSIALV